MRNRNQFRHATLTGEHEYVLSGRQGGGVFMLRKVAAPAGAAVEQSILFASEAELVAWCEDDPVLRQNPLLDQDVRRSGRELLRRE